MNFLTEIPDFHSGIFDSISIPAEFEASQERKNILSYRVTPPYPWEELPQDFYFVCDPNDPIGANSFSINQSFVLLVSSDMFKESTPLTDFEDSILDFTYRRLVKTVPTLPGRN